MQSTVVTYTECLSAEKESFEGQICHCMPMCSDHSLLVRLNGAFVQLSPAGDQGKFNSASRPRLTTKYILQI